MTHSDLRNGRLALGLTQEDLAAKAGLSERTIKRAEAGMPSRPATLRAIRDALGRETSVALMAERLAGDKGFALPRLTLAGMDHGYGVEPLRTATGARAWMVVCGALPGVAFDASLKPHETKCSPEKDWAFGNLSDALVAMVLLDRNVQRLEDGITREWGYADGTRYVRLPTILYPEVAAAP